MEIPRGAARELSSANVRLMWARVSPQICKQLFGANTFLAIIDVLKTWRDTRRDCGKLGCPNDIPTGMPHEATSKSGTSAHGTSRHFVALRNLVAIGGIADIDQARFMSTRPTAVGTTAKAGHRPLADSCQPTFDASTTTLVLIPTRS